MNFRPFGTAKYPPEIRLKAAAELELRRRRQAHAIPMWAATARPEQLPPLGDWRVWLILAGRGWGKTRTGAEWLHAQAQIKPRVRVIAPTFADARDVCVEGESGLYTTHRADIETWNRSLGEIHFRNGARCKLYSADEPERLRGPQSYADWYDELAAWRYAQQTWDMAMMGLRLGDNPQVCVTTTPRPIPLVKLLLHRHTTTTTRGSTFDNRANLAQPFFDAILAQYEGTTIGRQELYAELLDDMPGALWQRSQIEQSRCQGEPPELKRLVVAIDPSATATGDEAGIVVAGIGADNHGYVLDDRSLQGSPQAWATAAVAAYHVHKADRLIAESNNGGEMVAVTIGTIADAPSVTLIHASRGKQARAEPVAALYEQGKVHHVGAFPKLEDELCQWIPGIGPSPNRLDALVWALTELMIGQVDPADMVGWI